MYLTYFCQVLKTLSEYESGFGAHGHQCSLHFYIFEKKLKSLTSIFPKYYGVKYIDWYMQEECLQKIPVKNTLYFGKYKKTNF
jgi:hypothetical protein